MKAAEPGSWPLPKPPGRLRSAARVRKERAAKAMTPYLLAYGGALAVALILGLVLAVPSLPPLPCLVSGAALAHAAIRVREAHGWHRDGGKAAQRKRRRFQGPATMPELHRRLGLGAARRNAAIMRPSLGGRTRSLPPEEAGVFIGTARRSR